MLTAWRVNMELEKEKSLLNNIHPMVRVLPNVSFMHRLFTSPRFRMNEKSYYYRKVEPLAFWNNHSTKQIWKCVDLLINGNGNMFAGF